MRPARRCTRHTRSVVPSVRPPVDFYRDGHDKIKIAFSTPAVGRVNLCRWCCTCTITLLYCTGKKNIYICMRVQYTNVISVLVQSCAAKNVGRRRLRRIIRPHSNNYNHSVIFYDIWLCEMCELTC